MSTNAKTTALYKQYVNLIRSRAHYYARAYRVDFDLLMSEGNVIFIEAIKSFDNTKAGFSTHLYNQLGRLKDVSGREQKYNIRFFGEINDEITGATPEDKMDHLRPDLKKAFAKLDSLPADVQYVVWGLLSGKIADHTKKSGRDYATSFKTAADILKSSGWQGSRIKSAWRQAQVWWQDYYNSAYGEYAPC